MASRSYPANTQIQKFLEESYNKERDVRLAWHAKLGPKDGGKSKQFEVFRRKIENEAKPADGFLSKVPKNVKEPRYNKKITQADDTFVCKSGTNLLSAEMRPVTPGVKEKLYDGFTKEGKGRYQYLEKRNEKNPEDKFSFPLLSSWEYGWRLGDVIKQDDFKAPDNGRNRIVADTFYTRTGIPTYIC
ncbi:protein ATP6V1FNB-like [Mercenaria mercenaria]|uniref:protein ATP6V1FNB-like n=1 Tax=Mercenaria mercenaria TaxID=6596 RepID=UPI00234EAE8B|nr:protein ATP6V1FNB-like [Mercenaria mercenaria]